MRCALVRPTPTLTASRSGHDALLTGSIPDQSALDGVIHQLEALGLPLLEIRREWRAGRRIEAGASDESPSRDSFRTDLAGRRLSRQPRKPIVVRANTY